MTTDEEAASAPLILVIEDSDLRLTLCDYLTLLGYRCVHADQGVRGYALALEETPALILLDVTMPGLNGFQVATLLRGDEATAQIPIVFLTGHAEKGAELEGLRAGADDYIAKPFDLDILAERVAAVLRRHPYSSPTTPREEL